MTAADRELIATLRTIHRVENPRAVDRLCREAADRIEQLAEQTAPEPKRRGRPPKYLTEV
jgi:plasmid stabilization system protein ParE